MRPNRRAFSLPEVLIALALLGTLIGVVVWLTSFGTRATGRLTPRLALHQTARKAMARFLADLQEGMEVVTPRPGITSSFAVVRDKLSVLRWYYLVPSPAGGPLFDLRVMRKDTTLPAAERDTLVLTNVKRLAFTCRTEGALQLNLELIAEDQDYPLLTTVRLRNIASAEELW